MNEAKLPSAEQGAYSADLDPQQSWQLLKSDPNAVLIDVRTDAEFAYVGIPDLSSLQKEVKLVSWILFPGNQPNPNFIDQCRQVAPDRNSAVLFLCRSGIRSRYAAEAATAAGYRQCYNVLEGFEGDRDPGGHRNTIGGWRVAGLPWVQS